MKTANQSFAAMQKAVSLHRQHQMPEAERSYKQVLANDPQHFDALRLLGALYLQWNKVGEAIDCFEKAHKLQPSNAELLNNLGVAFYNQGKIDEAVKCYEQAVQLAPEYKDAINNLGNLYHTLGKPEEAIDWFRQSIKIDFDNIDILYKLGNLLRETGRSEEAASLYQRLVVLQPDNMDLRNNLGTILHDMGKWDEALQECQAVLKAQPNSTDALINHASLLMEYNRPQEARAGYERALSLNPALSDAKWGKSLATLMLGDYHEGWALYEARFERRIMQAGILFRNARWDGSSLQNKQLLIWGEQGLGDILQFIRYAELCKKLGGDSGQIIVQCPRPLVRILQNCPFIDEVVTQATEKDFDYQISVMSLPHLFKTTLETVPNNIPYLFVGDEARRKWAPRFTNVDKKLLKVGLVWAGNPRKSRIDAHITDRQRSLKLEMLKPILDYDSCSFYSLQKGEAAAEIDANGLGTKIIDYMPDVDDMMDTAAIIENLDLVISVDTSVVHLTGGMGKPVWILSRFGGCWRWLGNQELNPWYPSARIFGQPSPGDWQSVIDKVCQVLKENIQQPKP